MLSALRTRGNPQSRSVQTGASLVELLVGVAVGLFIVAGATLTVSTQLSENKRLLAETQLQQDLRAAADIMTRELRRSGYWLDAHRAVALVNRDALPNPLSGISATSGANAQATYQYRRAVNQEGPYGFRLHNGTLQMQVDGGTWQELTDSRVMQVTAFGVQGFAEPSAVLPCPKACADGSTDCWPRNQLRGFVLSIDAQSRTDTSVTRSLVTTVRLRNDLVEFRVAGAPTQACPT
jgi:type IV pilus assembly protein PilW